MRVFATERKGQSVRYEGRAEVQRPPHADEPIKLVSRDPDGLAVFITEDEVREIAALASLLGIGPRPTVAGLRAVAEQRAAEARESLAGIGPTTARIAAVYGVPEHLLGTPRVREARALLAKHDEARRIVAEADAAEVKRAARTAEIIAAFEGAY